MGKPKTSYHTNACGLLFTEEEEPKVVLARRHYKEMGWVYDGLGGEVDWPPSVNEEIWEEFPRKELSRHVYAQCGVVTTPEQWKELVSLRGTNYEIRFYATQQAEAIDAKAPALDDDRITLNNPFILPLNIISHLTWLIPLALDENVQKPLGLQAI